MTSLLCSRVLELKAVSLGFAENHCMCMNGVPLGLSNRSLPVRVRRALAAPFLLESYAASPDIPQMPFFHLMAVKRSHLPTPPTVPSLDGPACDLGVFGGLGTSAMC